MSKKILFLSLTIIFAFTLSLGFSALADEETTITDEVVADAENLEEVLDEIISSADDITLAPAEELSGININEPSEIPNAWNLFWRNVKEKVSLTFTFNENKKSEKLLQYAEERAKIAELIAEASDNPEMQEKATAILDKAAQYMEKIMEKKEAYLERTDEQSAKLLENIAKHELNKERVLEKIEDKVPIEKLEQFQAFRQGIEQKTEKFFGDIKDNDIISDELKQIILEQQQLIQNTIQEREQIRNQNQELLNEAKSGNEAAQTELQQKRMEILEQREKAIAEMQAVKQELIENLTSGNEQLKANALKQIKNLNDIKTTVETQIKINAQNMIQERNQIMQNDSENNDEASQVRAENQNRIEQIEKMVELITPAGNQAGKNN